MFSIHSKQANPLIISGWIGKHQVDMLIDTGASLTLVNFELYNKLPVWIQRRTVYLKDPIQLRLANKSHVCADKYVILPITVTDYTVNHRAYVVPNLGRTCIIGNDFIRKHDLQVDGGEQQVFFKRWETKSSNPKVCNSVRTEGKSYVLCASERLKIPPYHSTDIQVHPEKRFYDEEDRSSVYELTSMHTNPCVANGLMGSDTNWIIQVANLSNRPILVHQGQKLAIASKLNQTQLNVMQQMESGPCQPSLSKSMEKIDVDLSETSLGKSQKDQLEKLIQKFADIFNDQNGRTNTLQHQINLLPGSKPINSPPYRYSPAKREAIEQNLSDMMEEGIIKPSKSPWASPVVLAPKKDGSMRFCVDYRKLNAITIRDAYPIPRIDDTLDSLQEARYLSTLDLRSGYWQVAMDKESKEKTAFITHKGLYEFNVMPFGLTNAPATFQRLMDIVLAGLKWQCCLVYIDDIVIYSPTFDKHLEDLGKVFSALREANLKLKVSKCCFCRKEMKYLGHIVTQDGIKPDPALVNAVMQFPRPKSIKDVQSFLGLTGYYRRFISNYAKIAEPLLKQLRQVQERNYHLHWSSDCTVAFDTLKHKLTSAPIMRTPDFTEPFILEVDACEYGLGAVLTQEYEGKKFVIAYASRTLSAPERKYGATEREALAIVWATQHFRPYLEGVKVLIRSDCKALQWLKDSKDVSGRLARWAMKLSAFQIESIQYRPGKANGNADSLSRNPVPLHAREERERKNHEHSPIPYEIATMETIINLWENTNILEDIKKEQQADSKLSPIIEQLKANGLSVSSDKRQPFVLVNDLLYKIKNSNRHYNQRVLGNKHLLVIPKKLQEKLLRWAHNHPTAGHGGQQKTLFRLSTRVYWASMRKDIFNYVAACPECQRFKYNNRPMANPMQLHEVIEPWHTIGIDIMGPFPVTSRQKRFLLVIVDYFTRWVEMFPMRTTTSEDISKILIDEVFARYGLPRYILSDNGPQFVSNVFDEFCQSFGIKRKFTANYHPQSNMTERVNRTLKPMISIFAQRSPHSWDKEIQQLAWAIRTSINETTGETPAFLMFGRDPRIPLDLMVGDALEGIPTQEMDTNHITNYRRNLINNLNVAFHTVQEHCQVEKWIQKEKYDRHTSQRQFEVGDLVWMANTASRLNNNSIRSKLKPKYQGPCRITKVLTPSTFVIQRIADNVEIGAVNVDRLKAYIIPQQRDSLESSNQSSAETEDEMYTDENVDRSSTRGNPEEVNQQTEVLNRTSRNSKRRLNTSFVSDVASSTAPALYPRTTDEEPQRHNKKRWRKTYSIESSNAAHSRSTTTNYNLVDPMEGGFKTKRQHRLVSTDESDLSISQPTHDGASNDERSRRRPPSKRQKRLPARFHTE